MAGRQHRDLVGNAGVGSISYHPFDQLGGKLSRHKEGGWRDTELAVNWTVTRAQG